MCVCVCMYGCYARDTAWGIPFLLIVGRQLYSVRLYVSSIDQEAWLYTLYSVQSSDVWLDGKDTRVWLYTLPFFYHLFFYFISLPCFSLFCFVLFFLFFFRLFFLFLSFHFSFHFFICFLLFFPPPPFFALFFFFVVSFILFFSLLFPDVTNDVYIASESFHEYSYMYFLWEYYLTPHH